MLVGITWGEYFTAMGILTVIYYAYIGIRYFPLEFKRLLSGRPIEDDLSPSFDQQPYVAVLDEEAEMDDEESDIDDVDDEFADVEELIGSLTVAIAKASKKKMIVAEFKQSIRGLLRSQPNLKASPFRSSLNELIVSECGKHGVFTPNEQEIDVLWEDTV